MTPIRFNVRDPRRVCLLMKPINSQNSNPKPRGTPCQTVLRSRATPRILREDEEEEA